MGIFGGGGINNRRKRNVVGIKLIGIFIIVRQRYVIENSKVSSTRVSFSE